jgi:hypothetical protein
MVQQRCIINLIGKHNLVTATQRDIRSTSVMLVDMERVFKKYFNQSPLIATNITQLYATMRSRTHPFVIFPGFKLQLQHAVPIYPSWNPPKPIRMAGDYRNLYFQVRPVTTTPKDVEDYLHYEIPKLPIYPIAGTDMEKVNLLEQYMF